MNLRTKLDQIEQQAKERGLSEAVLVATGEQWQNMTEAERDRMQQAAQQVGTPIVIIDR
mgnify:FL=1